MTDDAFEEWLRVPVAYESPDPRFEARRATPSEFEQIYDVVDEAFGTKRPRAAYDWLYRRNPLGIARCYLVFDKASGLLLGSEACWPWPLARGEEMVSAYQSGDSVTHPGWQRLGLNEIRAGLRRAHPWRIRSVGMSWPNEKSRGASQKYGSPGSFGPLPRAVLLLRAGGEDAAGAGVLKTAAGAITTAGLRAWAGVTRRTSPAIRVDPIARFDSSFDTVTKHCMKWDGYWCPHDAEFLNWRYCDHPTNRYQALALEQRGELAAYCVVRTDGRRAWLMEFAAPDASTHVARALLLRACELAREAGCDRLEFAATPRWRHWTLFRSLGFVRRPSELFLFVRGPLPDTRELDLWQCLPGDIDVL